MFYLFQNILHKINRIYEKNNMWNIATADVIFKRCLRQRVGSILRLSIDYIGAKRIKKNICKG